MLDDQLERNRFDGIDEDRPVCLDLYVRLDGHAAAAVLAFH